MNDQNFKREDIVSFGRPNGEQTLGKVLQVNAKSLSVAQLEERGVTRVRGAGVKWRVARSFCRHATDEEKARVADVADAPSLARCAAPAEKRPDAQIMLDIRRCYTGLSPEYLFADGERSRSAAMRLKGRLNAELARLFRELGRKVTEDEAYAVPLAEAVKAAGVQS